jgi:hypothetical protein
LSSTVAPPSLQAVNDLNGDGLDDVLAISPGKPGSMTAERGDTGATIWSAVRNVAAADFVTSAGRLSGGTTDDLAIQGGRVSLVRGSDGKLLWTRHGVESAVPLGRGRPGERPALALVRRVETDSFSSTGHSSQTNSIGIKAVTATNKLAWHVRIAATVHSTISNHSTPGVNELNTVDVQPDGTADFALRVATKIGSKHAHRAGIVNGRNGRFRRVHFGPAAAGSLVRGAGTDLLHATVVSHGIVVSGSDGVTGRLLMRRLVRIPGRSRQTLVRGLRSTGHRCSDIEAGAVHGRGHVALDMLSGSGARLWSVRYRVRRANVGRLLHYKAPHDFCAAE